MMGHKAILHIYSTFNNVLITATDLTGAETVCKVSGGMVTKGGSDSGGQFAATRAAEKIAEMLAEKDFDQVIVKYRGAGAIDLTALPEQPPPLERLLELVSGLRGLRT